MTESDQQDIFILAPFWSRLFELTELVHKVYGEKKHVMKLRNTWQIVSEMYSVQWKKILENYIYDFEKKF